MFLTKATFGESDEMEQAILLSFQYMSDSPSASEGFAYIFHERQGASGLIDQPPGPDVMCSRALGLCTFVTLLTPMTPTLVIGE